MVCFTLNTSRLKKQPQKMLICWCTMLHWKLLNHSNYDEIYCVYTLQDFNPRTKKRSADHLKVPKILSSSDWNVTT